MLVFSAMGLYPLLFYQPLSAGIAVSFYISTSIDRFAATFSGHGESLPSQGRHREKAFGSCILNLIRVLL